MIVVSNSTPLIALAKIDCFDLLRELFGAIVVPTAVYDEVVTHAQDRPGAAQIRQAGWIQTQVPADQTKVDYLRADLDHGEAEVLVLAEQVSANWVLLDEPKARLAAELLGLKFMGTIGLLLLSKRMGKAERVRPLLDKLKMNKFHLAERVYQAAVHPAGE